MREAPADVTPHQVLAALREHWRLDVDDAEHLPVGFGAHHWVASSGGRRGWFVTLDGLLPRHSPESLEAAYAGAAALASRLDFVLACLPTPAGPFTTPFAGGALSVVPWLDGSSGFDGTWTDDALVATTAMLDRLHAASVVDLPVWQPLLADPATFTDGLSRSLARPWDTGPFGEVARHALDQQVGDIRDWARRYGDLAARALALRESWVPTHGEPDPGNQLVAHGHRFLVDWESLKLAPRERDLWALGQGWESSYSSPTDPGLLELFDLEWRLDEIGCYATWFASPHSGSESDEVALQGLLDELERE
ncbi:MAG TPA: hypothetical protein VFL69_02175 [Marmoricola sp.]|nr:hypothetical protein [Marmoricola sp.]